ncbi:MAG: c-type cytochrome [Nitrospinae bacterium]|nr:c-type cytochrome [Nitrospinota bacterium]
MTRNNIFLFLFIGVLSILFLPGSAAFAEKPSREAVVAPRVPADKMGEAQALTNPLPQDAGVIAKGRELYLGKGACASCHGAEGKGDGQLAESFNPPPRDFTGQDNYGWHEARTDGEIYWSIAQGTDMGMMAFGDMISQEECWQLVSFIRSLRKNGASR